MKPGRLGEIYSHYRQREYHQRQLEELAGEDPGTTEEAANIDSWQRYSSLVEAIKNLQLEGDNSGGIKTPALPYDKVEYDSEEVQLLLYFELESPSSLSEVMTIHAISDRSIESKEVAEKDKFDAQIWFRRDEVPALHLNPLLQNKLNSIEAFFEEYKKLAYQLTPEQARDLGFSERFIQELGASNYLS